MVSQSPILRAQIPSYKSPYGPNAVKMGAFGGVALFGVIFFASGIPRVQRDILQKIPVIGNHYIKEIPASDNPF
ncbi:hypothetical protein NPX13_g9634 [Xylaria arbuscula]|uniref:Cytochrome b-c1 complex subunit 10 n=1 Tax=Xylaria arbuscula TaxID=114810 RepID=A0A9W8TIV0_9PEZI|nr:hypothetical protein NPX13_g9634 [Xylaria arbuscula]